MPRRTRGTTSAGSATEQAHASARGDRGAGLFATVAGVTVFLALVVFAVQLLVYLYSASVVTSAAYDAARRVASTPEASAGAVAAAEAEAREILGRGGDAATFEWDLSDADVVRLRVVVDDPLLWQAVDRTVRVRVEELR